MDAHPVRPAIVAVVEQHAAECAALGMLRSHACRSPRHNRRDIEQLDARFAAHLDGVREAEAVGWEVVLAAAVANPEIGEVMTLIATALLVPEQSAARLAQAFAALPDCPAVIWYRAGMVVRWLADPLVVELMARSQRAADTRHRAVALGAARQRGWAVPGLMAESLRDPTVALFAAEVAGALGDPLLRPALRTLLTSDDMPTRFAAAQALVLRGDEPTAWRVAMWFAEADVPQRRVALDLLGRCAQPASMPAWINRLAGDPTHAREALLLAAAWGDPQILPWVVGRLRDATTARLAGWVVTMITGIDLVEEDLSLAIENDDGVTDDPEDPQVYPDPDHDLPWPDAAAVEQRIATLTLSAGVRHLAGRPIDPETCVAILAHGYQPQRWAAAVELVRLQGGVLPAL